MILIELEHIGSFQLQIDNPIEFIIYREGLYRWNGGAFITNPPIYFYKKEQFLLIEHNVVPGK